MSPTPPVAKRVTHRTDRHGRIVEDDWAWLADRDDPDTLAYLEAENTFSDAWFAERAGLTEAIFDEIKGRTLETDLSAPVRKGDWWYLARTVEGLSYPIHVRRTAADDARATATASRRSSTRTPRPRATRSSPSGRST